LSNINILAVYLIKIKPMKPFVFLLFSIFILKVSYAQPGASDFMVMSVEKKSSYDNDPVNLQFKPQSFLKIKTMDGKKLRSANYTLQDSALVMVTLMGNGLENIDTIPFGDIVKIRGKVYGNAVRKIGGTILALGGVPLAAMGYIGGTFGSSPTGAVFMMLPGIGLTASGISIIGARSFNTSDKWSLKTTPSVN
jgi:hypothetical protein